MRCESFWYHYEAAKCESLICIIVSLLVCLFIIHQFQVFVRPAMQAIFKPMDWLTTRVDDVKAWFKSDSDAAMLAEFKRINICRHQKDSFS